jgi:hypothetical protein
VQSVQTVDQLSRYISEYLPCLFCAAADVRSGEADDDATWLLSHNHLIQPAVVTCPHNHYRQTSDQLPNKRFISSYIL